MDRKAFIASAGFGGVALAVPTILLPPASRAATGLPRALRQILSPHAFTSIDFARMRALGIVSIIEHGYEYHNSGQVTRAAIPNAGGCPQSHPLDSCACDSNGNCNNPPGDGNPQGYPTIGQVAVNYSYAPPYLDFSGAIFTGDFSLGGPHLGLYQTGFGAVWKAAAVVAECTQQHLASIAIYAGAVAAAIQKYGVARWGAPLVQALATATLRWGPVAGWTPGAAADFIGTLIADIATGSLLDVFVAAGLGTAFGVLLVAIAECIAKLTVP